jgi:hypothetical protein
MKNSKHRMATKKNVPQEPEDTDFTPTRATTRQRDAVLGATIAALLDVPASSADIVSFVRTATTAVATLNTCTTNASRR